MLGIGASGTRLTSLLNISRAQDQLGKTTERLATGLRINRGSDDPAGLIAAVHLRGDLVEISAEARVIDYQRQQISIEQSGRQAATDVLHDVQGLIVQASGNTISDQERQAIQSQIDSSIDGLRTIANTTGISVSGELFALGSGGPGNVVNGDTALAAEIIEARISELASASAEAGAYAKYSLDVDQRLAEDRAVLTLRALSQTADADFAREASNLARDKILLQASLQTAGMIDRLRGETIMALLG